MNISSPSASSIGSVSFGALSSAEVKQISAKRIYNPVTLDPLGHPLPGGLYDLALGAWLDNSCNTCHLNGHHCPGHAGHIELPVPVYHPIFLPQLLYLLKSTCAYCNRLRLVPNTKNRFICKLRLLQYGLIEEAKEIDTIDESKKDALLSGLDEAASDTDDEQSHMKNQNTFVRRKLKEAKNRASTKLQDIEKSQATFEARRQVIREFFAETTNAKACGNCRGISPKWRKNGHNKIFRVPLQQKQQAAMDSKGLRSANPFLRARKEQSGSKHGPADEAVGIDDEDLVSEEEGEETTSQDGPLGLEALQTSNKKRESSSQSNTSKADQYVTAQEVHATIISLFAVERDIFNLIYSPQARKHSPSNHADLFFIWNLVVPPNKYRPETKTSSGELAEARENTQYKAILTACERLNQIKHEILGAEADSTQRQRTFGDFQNTWISLQDAVNSMIDQSKSSSLNSRIAIDGIKQRLEKKEGLFRMHMMGKRVNFAARSVISPDPNLETNEVGVPPVFARKLTYPETVTNHNFYELKQAVINGCDTLPGASAIENETGQVINLRTKNPEERQALANQLLAPSSTGLNGTRSKKVHRHLLNGDIVLMNRQPTLHKPSIMAHRVRILPGEKTIRMHYANCNTYNADFDGDEMNMHFPQNELARAEAVHIADTDHQYLSATAGKPLRGLIQDHISMGVWLTNLDTFFDREDYYQLLCSCLRPERDDLRSQNIITVPPALVKPRTVWTGKQVVTTVLRNLTPATHEGLTINTKSSTGEKQWGNESEEPQVRFQEGYLLHGILDKAQLGPSAGGLIHAVYEAYGHTAAGKLLSVLGRLLTKLLHMRAFSCGMEDLHLTKAGDATRLEKLSEADAIGREVAAKYVTLDTADQHNDSELRDRLGDVLRDDSKQAGLDDVSSSKAAILSSDVTKACLPMGLAKPFPRNHMQLMTSSGAKGSMVNANLISCNLGQQALEGRRVPVMISGKTLPSFKPFETSLRAGGYIANRFLTGVKPQEYYFHAMSGREGLIDTAVKTARSGYLQRCIIKGMEGLRTEYDLSVRDADGSMVQFLYGEDGLDVTKQKLLMDHSFVTQNCMSMIENLNIRTQHDLLRDYGALAHQKAALKALKKTGRLDAIDPVLAHFNPSKNLGSNSEKFANNAAHYASNNPDLTIKKKGDPRTADVNLSKSGFNILANMNYLRSTVEPGEAVGVVAGQSIGEPSTQMTLNTFHLAGHAAKNVTLGIPRLREILMVASKNISTPSMTLHFIPEITKEAAEKLTKSISKLSLAEIINHVTVDESVGKGMAHDRAKLYRIRLDFFPSQEYCDTYAISIYQVLTTVGERFVAILARIIKMELQKRARASAGQEKASQPEVGRSSGKDTDADGAGRDKRDGSGSEGEAESDEDEDPESATVAKKRQNRNEGVSYDEPDEDEETIAVDARKESASYSDDEVDSALGASPKPAHDYDTDSDDDKSDEEPGDDNGQPKKILGKQERKEVEATAKKLCESLTKFTFDYKHGRFCEIQLEYSLATSKLLLLPLVESACKRALIQYVEGVGSCMLSEESITDPETKAITKVPVILTEGVNLTEMHDHQNFLNPHKIFANDVWKMMSTYGVEAGRATIIREMDAVFQRHSITVDNRHLNLIADFMTREGGFKPFSRIGLASSASPLQKASFETTTRFIADAVAEADWDDLRNPSAKIVAGNLSGVGTGAFDVLVPLDQQERT